MFNFAAEVEQLIPKLRQYASSLARDPAQADDLVQGCVAKALEKQSLWAEGTDLRAWLFTIMHNEFVTLVRRSANSPVVTIDGAGIWHTTGLVNQEDRLRIRDLRRAMAIMPGDYRRLVLMIALEDVSYEDAAQTLDIPIGTVKSRLSRAREMLRDLMDTGRAGRTTLSRAAA